MDCAWTAVRKLGKEKGTEAVQEIHVYGRRRRVKRISLWDETLMEDMMKTWEDKHL